jgi:predicted DNA-binding helix-hairpin-helix protein
MDAQDKVVLLGQASQFDVSSEPGTTANPRLPRREVEHYISTAFLPRGGCIKLMKVLSSSICENDCAYCEFRASRDVQRAAFTPDELARCFDAMLRAGLVQGLFLSSGICHNAVREMDRMLAAVEIVRRRYHFSGYIHLKLLPGAEEAQIACAAQLADRVSTNLEAPNSARLARLSEAKIFETQLMQTLRIASQLVKEARHSPGTCSGVTTQFVVGAADETDSEILSTSAQLYDELGLARTYYSAFTPIPNTPLENRAPTAPLRQHRLYQSDFLLRQYGFTFHDLVFSSQGNLPTDRDPKSAWAEAHPEVFPIEVNTAERTDLLRIPGVGPIIADRILKERRRGRLTDLSHLRRMGARIERAAGYVLLNGRPAHCQLSLWSDT